MRIKCRARSPLDGRGGAPDQHFRDFPEPNRRVAVAQGPRGRHSRTPGRPPKLSAEAIGRIARAAYANMPQQVKFEFGLWTPTLIRHLINRQFKKGLSVSWVRRLMKILGVSAQKPLYPAWQQGPLLVPTWEAETSPAIRAEAKRVGATIYLADESGIRSD